MRQVLDNSYMIWPLSTLLVLLLLWLAYRRWGPRQSNMQRVFNDIGFDQITGLIIPNGDDGEIQIDRLLLTSRGLLVIDIKDVTGNVFGSDKMQDWTVIGAQHRHTFANPQSALYDRVAAVRQIVREVPVVGRIVFTDNAEFAKGTPAMVCSINQLRAEFHETNRAAAEKNIEAFKPHWELIRHSQVS